jgi:threonine dehydratase
MAGAGPDSMSAYLSSLTPVFTRHTYALRESIDVSRSFASINSNWPLAVVVTTAEGIAVKNVGALTLPIAREFVSDIKIVSL